MEFREKLKRNIKTESLVAMLKLIAPDHDLLHVGDDAVRDNMGYHDDLFEALALFSHEELLNAIEQVLGRQG